jgi:hypothetical protein
MFGLFARSLRRPAVRNPQDRPGPGAVEPLEKRQLLSASPVFAGTKIKGINLSANNISTNSTLITIPFTGNINIADASKIQLRGYAINPLSSKFGQVKKVVNVTSAKVLDADHRYLQLTTDRLMRKNGIIFLYEGALKDDSGNTLAFQELHTLKGQNKERFTLACRAYNPADFTRFSNDIFAASPSPASLSSPVPDDTVTANLDSFLQAKVTAGVITQAKKDAAMTTYNSDAAKLKIPSANLRAALMSLTGTFAAPAIDLYLGPQYTIVAVQSPSDPSVPVAQTTARSDGKLRTVFRPEYQGESFIALSDAFAHEALHEDNNYTLQEEVVANVMGTLVAVQQAQTDSSWMKTPTKLVNSINQDMYAMLNSGRTIFPYVGVLQAPMLNANKGIFPGQKAASDGGGVYKSFDDYVRRIYIQRGAPNGNSPGNSILSQYYTAVTNVQAPANLQFSDAIINQVDAFQQIMGTHQAIVVAQALHMTLS